MQCFLVRLGSMAFFQVGRDHSGSFMGYEFGGQAWEQRHQLGGYCRSHMRADESLNSGSSIRDGEGFKNIQESKSTELV